MKPTVLLLGTYHMANPGADAVNFEADEVLAPKRQRELQQLVEQLARFNPTKIAVEVDTHWETELQKEYDAYLKDNFQLKPHEIHQIGFRLAKQMGHPKVLGIIGTSKLSSTSPESRNQNMSLFC